MSNDRLELEALRTASKVKAHPARIVTQAPPPIKPLGGRSWIPSKPTPAEMPTQFPPDFPSSLKLKTMVILAGIVKQFLDRSKLEQLCRAIVSGLTVLLCEAVREGSLKGHAAPDQLNQLLHYVRVTNCPNNDNERFRVERAVKNSEEWLDMLKELAKCEHRESHDSSFAGLSRNPTRKKVEDFIVRMRCAGISIKKMDIWRMAGYSDATNLRGFNGRIGKRLRAVKQSSITYST